MHPLVLRPSGPSRPTAKSTVHRILEARFSPIAVGLALTVLTVASPSNAASDWPGFRGPDQDGRVEAPGLFEGETVGLAPAWSQRLGSSYSGIAIADGRVYTMASIGEDDVLVALDEERGTELWRYRVGPRTRGHDGSEDGPAVTPLAAEGLVHSASSTGRLFTLDADTGEELWSVDLRERFASAHPIYDYVASPARIGDAVVALAPSAPDGALVAFDRRSGEHLWSAAPGDAEYVTPVVATLAGEPQVLVWHKERVVAVDASGAVLWEAEFGPSEDTSPVVFGDDRVLLKGIRSSALYRVARTDDGWTTEQLWESRHLKGNMSAPVHFEGHLYGFDTRFLSCVDAETGERVWKSRPPGGNGVILIDDRLVVYGSDGHVVVVRATPEGYQEETRYKATERESLTWPAFAAGKIFVRDATHLAALRITDQPTPVQTTDAGPPVLYEGSEFTAFVRAAEASDDPGLWVDDFFRRHRDFPIVEGDLIHFVYRGQATDVAVLSPVWDPAKDFPLKQLGETNFFYRTMQLDPMTRLEYAVRVDLERVGPDPLHPRLVERYPGVYSSELVPEGWEDPPWLAPWRGDARGRFETLTVESEHTGDSREIELWLPIGAEPEGLLLALDGRSHRSLGRLPNTLSFLEGDTLRPIAVAFVPPKAQAYWTEADGYDTDELASMLASDVVPAVEEHLGLDFGADETTVLGVEAWASAALHAGLLEPATIGRALVVDYGGTFTLERELDDLLSEPVSDGAARFLLAWPRHSFLMTDRFVGEEEARELDRRLRTAGFEVEGREWVDSTGWGFYRRAIPELLERVYPAER